jgi:hypothetical protein
MANKQVTENEWAVVRQLIERQKAEGICRLEAESGDRPLKIPRTHLRTGRALTAAAVLLLATALGVLVRNNHPGILTPDGADRALELTDLPLFRQSGEPAPAPSKVVPSTGFGRQLAAWIGQSYTEIVPASSTVVIERGDPAVVKRNIEKAIRENTLQRFMTRFAQIKQEVRI